MRKCSSQCVGYGETVRICVVIGLVEKKTGFPGKVWVKCAGAIRVSRKISSKRASSRGEYFGGKASRGSHGAEVEVGADRFGVG